MAKTKSPLLSLGAKGTIGDTLTFQKKGHDTMARAKPIPKDPYSLRQAYQRWDYRDYAYLWTLLSNSEKQVYRSRASRYHITGFSQFMRESLKDLTNLAGRWHLDEKAGAIACDTSRNANNATIVGASPIDGLIAGAYHFDGLNDWIDCGSDPILLPDIFSFECFYKLQVAQRGAIASFTNTNSSILDPYWGSDRSIIYLGVNNARIFNHAPVNIIDGNWHHLVFKVTGNTKPDITNSELWADGRQQTIITTVSTGTPETKLHLYIGKAPANWMGADLDHIALYDRLLDETEIIRHSGRRYPS